MEYISVEHQKALAQRYKTAMILAFVFLATVLVIILIARIITPKEVVPGSEKWMQPMFASVIAIGLIVVFLRRILMSQMVLGQASLRGVNVVLDKLMTATIVCLAIAEFVAILGLVFYFLTGDYQYSWRLGVVSVLLILYSFPRRGEWERVVIASAKAQSDSVSAAGQAAKP